MMRTTSCTTPLHVCTLAYLFTGKERDAESGLDNFGARYMSSTMGRFMSPDYSDDPVPVPYASLGDPQSLNLYAYAGNNPMTFADEDGHSKDCGDGGDKSVVCLVTSFWDWLTGGGSGSKNGDTGTHPQNPDPNFTPQLRTRDNSRGREIINHAIGYQGVPYSQNVSASSPDNKPGTRTGIDCSHLVCFAAGLIYSRAEDVANNPNLRKLKAGEAPQDGDIVVFVGGGHVVLWDSSPPKPGANLLGATTHHGVTWLPMANKAGTQTFGGTPVFYRLK
jgi:RHS repeat-associated protein